MRVFMRGVYPCGGARSRGPLTRSPSHAALVARLPDAAFVARLPDAVLIAHCASKGCGIATSRPVVVVASAEANALAMRPGARMPHARVPVGVSMPPSMEAGCPGFNWATGRQSGRGGQTAGVSGFFSSTPTAITTAPAAAAMIPMDLR